MLELDSFVINPIQTKDSWSLCDFMVSNEERFKSFFPGTLQQNLNPTLSKLFAEQKVKQYQLKEEFLFSVKDKATKELAGLVYIKNLDWQKKQGEFAYCIGYQFEGKGIMTKIIKALSEYAFNTLDLKTLQIITHKSNHSNIRIAEKCNFTWQETLINEFTPPGKNPLDMELYELSRPEKEL